ncbi:MAG: GGDEF domain-containing protein, partial [Candidatus Cloacimonadota bacterium]|nr:GGDEF domain-containing protein [Candidatus Cloacimonadota bacterium]
FPKGLRKKLKNVFNSLEKKEKRSVKGFKYLLEEISKSLYSINTIIDDIDGEFEYKLSIFEDRSKIEQAKSRLKKMANFDSLTGIGNRRHIKHFLNLEKHRYDRYKVTFAILIADIDDFKSFNDTYGHYCGDYVLREISEIFNDTIRKVDKVARWGGEEFLFLLPQTDNKGIDKISEKIRKKVEKHTFIYNEHKLHITISIGGSRITNTSQNYEDVIEEADKALYLAKRNGKNQCELFDVTK